MDYKIERVFHPYWVWEDFKNGMWNSTSKSERQQIIDICLYFMEDTDAFGTSMLAVVDEWPISCEHNLTSISNNRRAWIGQAASCMATGSPEDVTRAAWGMLSEEKKEKANKKADTAIELWEDRYRSKIHNQEVLF
jgi:hypothetical protein